MFSQMHENDLDLLFSYSISIHPNAAQEKTSATPAQQVYIQDIIMYGGYRLAAQLKFLPSFISTGNDSKEQMTRREWLNWGMRKELEFFLSYIGYAQCHDLAIKIPPPMRLLATEMFDAARWGIEGTKGIEAHSRGILEFLDLWILQHLDFESCWWTTESFQQGATPQVIGFGNLKSCLESFRGQLPIVYRLLRQQQQQLITMRAKQIRPPTAFCPSPMSPDLAPQPLFLLDLTCTDWELELGQAPGKGDIASFTRWCQRKVGMYDTPAEESPNEDRASTEEYPKSSKFENEGTSSNFTIPDDVGSPFQQGDASFTIPDDAGAPFQQG
ncbi:hypothetical protein CVT24_010401, partial [Panaeolus cyanescens]